LTRKMQATAKIMDFEQAAKLRDTINLLSDWHGRCIKR
jgi:excinuclease UvrABC nuclease subunit